MSAPVDIVTVAGDDAEKYLQGQLSQDVAALAVGAKAWTFVLAPTGKIDAFALVTRTAADAYDLGVDGGFGQQLEARLRRFLLRTKATITLTRADSQPSAADEHNRIDAGRPSMAFDIDERTVPAETGWVRESVSFTKGCYTGQELVARMDSRVAEPPRRLVRITSDSTLSPGDAISVADAAVGTITSATSTEAGTIALGYLKRGTPLRGDALVGESTATIEGPVGADA